MTSILRQLQSEWNSLVPQAQARGIRRVRVLGQGDVSRAPLETIAYRRAKVEWLRALLGETAVAGQATQAGPFDSLTFGVEVECILPPGCSRRSAAAAITAAGVPCHEEGYSHSTPGQWKVVTDGSLGYDRGAEFVSPPIRGEAGFRQLKVVCDTLTHIGAKITSRCGLHVHVGVEPVSMDLTQFFKNLVTLYSSAERAIDTFMPQSRRGSNNVYCQPLRPNHLMASAGTVAQVVQAVGQSTSARTGSRYCKLNLQSYFAYGTVEFRHHGGTVDGVKATNWVRLCMRMVLAARAGERVVSTVDDLLDAVGADEVERQYFRSRVAYFNRDTVADRFSSYGAATQARRGHVEHQPVSFGLATGVR